MNSPHLLVAVSSHGFGHVAQVAPVVNALRALMPHVRITLRTAAPRALLESRILAPFEIDPVADDFGMVQHSALAVDLEASAARYRAFHAQWEERVDQVARALMAARADLILADVPYLSLAASARADIPSFALCSLHWADIYRHYFGHRPEAPRIVEQMLDGYRSARAFLRPTPSMPMSDLANARAIGPIAAVGRDRRAELAARFGINATEKLVLVTLGGIATRLPAENWPSLPGVRWIFQRDWSVRRDDALVLEDLGLPFSDVLASSDLFFTKPGYGSFAEAAAAGVPVLYVERRDWPEAHCLAQWLHQQAHAAAISPEEAAAGNFGEKVAALFALGRSRPVAATGAAEAAEAIATACR